MIGLGENAAVKVRELIEKRQTRPKGFVWVFAVVGVLDSPIF